MPTTTSANRIGVFRQQARLTECELARRVGLRREVLGRYEDGKRDTPAWVGVRIAEVLGVTVEDLAFRRVVRPTP